MSEFIPLDSYHVLRVQSMPDRSAYAGEVIMLPASEEPLTGTIGIRLFSVPVHNDVVEMTAWAMEGLKAFKEG